MKRSVEVVNTLTGALLDDKQEGDPDDVISFDELTLMLGKEGAGRMSNVSYTSQHGAVMMPDISKEDWANSCVERKVLRRLAFRTSIFLTCCGKLSCDVTFSITCNQLQIYICVPPYMH